MKVLLPYIIKTLKGADLKHEVNSFPSGAFMIDIWIADRFYVIQIDGDMIGLSLETEDSTPFSVIPDQSFWDINAFTQAFEAIFPAGTVKKTIMINGNHFSTLEGFYVEIDNVLTKGLGWDTGHNLDAFNDILRGGFGIFDEEPIQLIWLNSDKSKADLQDMKGGQPVYQKLVEIIRYHPHIEFFEN